MLSPQLQPEGLDLCDLCVGHDFAVARIHQEFSHLPDYDSGVSQDGRDAPKLFPLIERRVGRAKPIRQVLP
jgi:hypothetical protein